jgi:hypothetical protein
LTVLRRDHTRNSVATDLAASGLTIEDVMAVSGWKTAAVARRYNLGTSTRSAPASSPSASSSGKGGAAPAPARGCSMNDQEKQAAQMQRLLDDGVKPHAERIAEVCLGNGGLAVVVFEADETWQAALRQHGWRGEPDSPCRRKCEEPSHEVSA